MYSFRSEPKIVWTLENAIFEKPFLIADVYVIIGTHATFQPNPVSQSELRKIYFIRKVINDNYSIP